MKAEIITIGDEILLGQTIDTNSAWLGLKLSEIGISVYQKTAISDDENHILTALKEAHHRADLIIVTGGLGPTKDDITKHTLVKYFNTELIINDEVLQNITAFFKLRGREMTDINIQQAALPKNCIVLKNKRGSAAGMWFEVGGKVYISMPGVPYEMIGIMQDFGLEKIKSHFKTPNIVYKMIYTIGVGESFLAETIEEWENKLRAEGLKLAYLPAPGMVKLRVTYEHDNKELAEKMVQEKIDEVLPLINEHVYSLHNDKIEHVVGDLLLKLGKTLSTAESCTGGNIAHLITSVPGASSYYMGSVLSYSNDVKIAELNVDPADIEKYGAVSEQVVTQLAKGSLAKFSTDYSIATTGIAGPTGGSDEKPIGTIWIAVASKKGVKTELFKLGNNRSRNIQVASLMALNMLRKELATAEKKQL
jgi:nicotinamide-nucleotide amidase